MITTSNTSMCKSLLTKLPAVQYQRQCERRMNVQRTDDCTAHSSQCTSQEKAGSQPVTCEWSTMLEAKFVALTSGALETRTASFSIRDCVVLADTLKRSRGGDMIDGCHDETSRLHKRSRKRRSETDATDAEGSSGGCSFTGAFRLLEVMITSLNKGGRSSWNKQVRWNDEVTVRYYAPATSYREMHTVACI